MPWWCWGQGWGRGWRWRFWATGIPGWMWWDPWFAYRGPAWWYWW